VGTVFPCAQHPQHRDFRRKADVRRVHHEHLRSSFARPKVRVKWCRLPAIRFMPGLAVAPWHPV
jgi:hypothetical protein